jgi:hypothetical protein
MMDGSRPRPFHERFDIEIDTEGAKQRFMNRVSSLIFMDLYDGKLISSHQYSGAVSRNVAYRLGETYSTHKPGAYVKGDFKRCLHVLEAMYEALEGSDFATELSATIERILRDSENDLGVDWQPPIFVRTGARLLDERLVNDSLRWLREREYKTVLAPFEKGLSHYLESTNKPERLADVVTDMYEATEALARVVTGNDTGLKGNSDTFIEKVKVSDYYKELLRDYAQYGNSYRHAVQRSRPRPLPSEPEVESFIYLTGLFIRLAIRTT